MSTTVKKSLIGATAILAALPATALAAPTISSAPNPSSAGDPVVIYGTAKPNAKVVLYHRVNPAKRFTVIQHTKADTAGRYEFTRADGVVTTNRNWYVKVNGERSNTAHQVVSALITANGPQGENLVTRTPYAFTGKVAPNHNGERVELQRQNASSANDAWKTIDAARIGRNGGYTIKHRFTAAGDANLRVHFAGDRRNVASDSDVLSYDISEPQHPNLTISSSTDPLTVGGTTSITGKLANVHVPTPVTLYGRTAGRGFSPVAVVNTDAAGNYTFAGQQPIVNTVYQVRGGGRQSAQLYEGVKDLVSATVSSSSVTAGATVTFSGAVSPDKTGHVIYLQRSNPDGSGWHNVQVSKVNAGSTFAIARRLTSPGTKQFRIRISGGPVNQAGVSAPITVNVANNATPL